MQWLSVLTAIVLVIYFCPVSSCAQLPPLIPFNANGTWGYSDSNGTLVVEPQYAYAGPLINGLAYVQARKPDCEPDSDTRRCLRFGILDSNGRQLIEPIFFERPNLHQNFNVLSPSSNEHGITLIVAGSGKVKYACDQCSVESMSDSTLIINEKSNGKRILLTRGNQPPMELNEDHHLKPAEQHILVAAYGYLSVDVMLPGVLRATKYQNFGTLKQKIHTLCDSSGNAVHPGIFSEIRSLGFGRLAAKTFAKMERININGKIEAVRLDASPLHEHALANHKLDISTQHSKVLMLSVDGENAMLDVHTRLLQEVRVHEEQGLPQPLNRLLEADFPFWPNHRIRTTIGRQLSKIEGFENDWTVFERDGEYGLIDSTGRELFYGRFAEIAGLSQGRAVAYRPTYTGGYRHPYAYYLIDTSGRILANGKAYKSAGPFRHDRARIQTQDGFGFVDLDGNLIVDTIYKHVGQYDLIRSSDSADSRILAVARTDSGLGMIDQFGYPIVPHRYDQITEFVEGYSLVKRDEAYTLVDFNGKEIFEPNFLGLNSVRHGLVTGRSELDSVVCLDTDGKLLSSFAGKSIMVVGRNLLLVDGRQIVTADGLKTYFQTEKSTLKYLGYQVFASLRDRHWHLIDKHGQDLRRPGNSEVRKFRDGLAAAKRGGGWTVLDSTLKELCEPHYAEMHVTDQGFAYGVKSGSQLILDERAQTLFSGENIELAQNFNRYGLIEYLENQHQGFIDTNGKVVLPAMLTNKPTVKENESVYTIPFVRHFNSLGLTEADSMFHRLIIDSTATVIFRFSDTLHARLNHYGIVQLFDTDLEDGSFLLFNTKERTIDGHRYINIMPKSEGYHAVQSARDSSWGYVDQHGKITVKPAFRYAGIVRNQHAPVGTTDRKYGLISMRGDFVLEPMFEGVTGSVNNPFHVMVQNKQRLIFNTSGKYICTLHSGETYQYLEPDHLAVNTDGKWRIFGLDATLVPGVYKDVHTVLNQPGVFRVQREDTFGYIDKYGRQYWRD